MIFPDGTPNRTYCVRLMAASTVFTMLYIGAVEGSDVFLAPKHVYRMTDEQAAPLKMKRVLGIGEAVKAEVFGRGLPMVCR